LNSLSVFDCPCLMAIPFLTHGRPHPKPVKH
jgi:hypothetical protein